MSKKMTQREQKAKAYEKAYKKELSRIKRFVKAAEKRGYRFDFQIPEPPKSYTKKQVEKLHKISPTSLYKKAKYYDLESGEILKGLEGRKLERSRAAYRGAYTKALRKRQVMERMEDLPEEVDTITENIESHLQQLVSFDFDRLAPTAEASSTGRPLKMRMYNAVIALYNRAKAENPDFAETINQNAERINDILDALTSYNDAYDNGDVRLAELAQLFLGRSLTSRESAELTEQAEMGSTIYD